MKRSLSIALLTASLGMPAVIAVSETCHVDFKEVWARKVKSIQAWNQAHPAYVVKHHLDRDMSAQTARMKERARKALEVMCDASGIGSGDLGLLHRGSGSGMRDSLPALAVDLLPDLPVEEVAIQPLLTQEEYPTYENPSRNAVVDGERGSYPSFGGWFGGGGYVGGDSAPPPVVPIYPTPEPSTLALTLAPMLILLQVMWSERRGKIQ